ncbi:DVUA0089 family protein [Myxococcota bacterium]|nr:DVUA0089 family protein [Myxococcota bacterium]
MSVAVATLAACGDDPARAICGNGTVETGEQCDDGNTTSGDGCSLLCRNEGSSAVCGNGRVEGTEECDDNNTTSGDGCSAACRTEATGPVCGDGTVDAGEQCDDGNTTSGDGCSATCQTEAPPPDCGDGTIDAGEQCDDGNTTSGDGCSATCQTEPPPPACGDGTIDVGEACDDGNTTSNDGCSATCAVESCGDGVQQTSEACDDGNTASNDGCSATCVVESCGDAIIQTNEQCEGADLAGATCLDAGFVGGTLSCNASCAFDTSACIGPGCGNGIQEPGEQCDDGNLGNDDGCSSLCLTESCGDGITQASEACDDGNAINTDACKNDCSLPSCGDTVLSTGEVCDDGNTANGDGCRSDCLGTEQCGDGHVDPAETCDDSNTTGGDGCSATCALEVCGDGVVNNGGLEVCDDGNTANGDCCSASCTIEAGCEIEANGTTATANDFGAVSLASVVWGFVSPASDVDVYRVTVPANGTATLTAETEDAFDGTTCASNLLDSYLRLIDSAGTVLAENDDLTSNYCSRVSVAGLGAGDYFVEVSASPFGGGLAFAYDLRITLQVAVCGDGTIDTGEACDDGNTTSGDGCSATCVLETTPETEPNDIYQTASGPVVPSMLPASGALTPAGDVDWFVITTSGLANLSLEVFDGTGVTCVGLDTLLDLYSSDGTTVLASDDDDGVAFCSQIASARDAGARGLAAGTYYARVRAYDPAAVVAAYRLVVTYDALCGDGVVGGVEECDGGATCDANCQRVPVCGDGFIDPPENCDDSNTTNGDGCSSACTLEVYCGNGIVDGADQCDDGNTAAGDGCDASCLVEAGWAFESGDNGSIATANGPFATTVAVRGAIGPAGDADYFQILVATTSDVRLETFDGDAARLTCAGMDTVMYFYDSAGTQLATNDDGGIGSCSLLDPATNAAVRRLAPGTYFVRVEDYLNDGTISAYQLAITFVSTCGDGAITSTEQCDDGNAVDDATCNSDCTTPACGDGRVGNTTGETCDDGNTTSGDGCDANCTATACGNGVVTTGEECDDSNLTNGDGCSSTCLIEELCGNGVLNTGEQCDDGNTSDGDGCSFSTTPRCQVEPGHFYEVEPNDDGATATSTNDFSAANANGPFTSSVIIHGAITPAGDDDIYAVTNTDAVNARTAFIDVYNAAPGYGLDVACGTSIDTFVSVNDATPTVLASNDDRNGSADRCSGLTYSIAAGATVYVRMIRFGDATAIPAPGYLLRIELPICGNGTIDRGEECEGPGTASCDATCQRVPVCGDGLIDGAEQCEDGNTYSGDGCSPACMVEGLTGEVEPNDTLAAADTTGVVITGNVDLFGSITDVTDELDAYRIEITSAPTVLSFEVFESLVRDDCPSSTFTPTLRLYDSAGTQIITDAASGIRSCSAITFPFESVGTYYVRIEEAGTNASLASYRLRVRTVADLGAEVEPNEMAATANAGLGTYTFVFGDHAVAADSDYYAITVPQGASVRAEVIEGSRATETCESLGIDSYLTLYGTDGTTSLATDDDDGRGWCSQIDGTGTTVLDAGAANLAAGTYYLRVHSNSTSAAGQFVYRLVLVVRTLACTDGVQNNDETGVDCGGPLCRACASCSDGIQNQGEVGIDCGGPCASSCLTSVTIAPSPVTLDLNGTVQLRATATYSDLSTADVTALASWGVVDGAVASVTAGLVTGLATGSTDVTASFGGVSAQQVISVSAAQCHVTINEVSVAGPSGASDELVEIYNGCASAVDLTGWIIAYRSATGTSDVLLVSSTVFNGMIMDPRTYRIFVNTTYSGGGTTDGNFASGGLAAAGGGLALRIGTDGTIVDSLGYGTATNAFIEGTVATAPASGQSLSRYPHDGKDTNVNSADLHVVARTPRAPNL